MSELEQGRPQAPLLDLFATAVHRFGSAWADLVVAAVACLAIGTVPVVAARAAGAGTQGAVAVGELSYTISFFLLVGVVVLRGLPGGGGGRRWAATGTAALATGLLAGAAVVALQFFAVAVLPLFLLAVPAVAAGDTTPAWAIPRGVVLAVRNFARVWAVWLLAMVFSTPIWISVALVVLSFSSGTTQFFVTLAVAAPIIWPFCALFVRALYGDLTGRLVVAPQDRSDVR